MNSAESFSASYAQARDKFRAAARDAGGQLDAVTHPLRGPGEETLSTDVAWFGERNAERVLVTISATHGIEGYSGSGAQTDWLLRGEAAALPAGVSALVIHAINPYGFAWTRRVTEDNVDLNRNWIDFDQKLPANEGYAELADAICPPVWNEETQRAANGQILLWQSEHNSATLQQAITGGQYTHPQGVFYGGVKPTWSRTTQTQIFADYLRRAGKIGIIDYHTGLGPWGFGEQIIADEVGSDAYNRAARWFGAAITSPLQGTSTSADVTGDGLKAAPILLGHAECTCVALEVGTLPSRDVLMALRADAWLHAHGDLNSDAGRAIKSQIRAAFYGEADDWKGMVAGQSLLACKQAIAGLML